MDLQTYKAKKDSISQSNIGKQYPQFSTVTLGGNRITEQILFEKVTVVNFWFQSCAPCIAEFEALSALYYKYKDNPKFQFVSFTFDSPEEARISIQKYQIPYVVCSISKEECYRLNLSSGFPTNLVLDKEGKVIYFKTGGNIYQSEVEKDIALMEQKIIELLNL
ncbi:TlpA family protein disulfide reductase [Dysgonomonas sp. ZJ279]|uniref:TlpA family protein disulfide reductase n=1 Tax=Dysgonomonas sp. ZJ279 TaxID=2709796 RepID=UPI0013ED5AE8|nr:TlpA disulfide reductase family protein [Dysgonomonas sp. ZJ279]